MSLISCNKISLAYEALPVVTDLTFSVEAGDFLYIIGENGSGKSTLAKALLGLRGVNGGKITFDPCLNHDDIGYMPQQTKSQKNFPASVFEVVMSGFCGKRRKLPFYTKAEKKTAQSNLRLLGVEVLKDRCYRELSGGQQQRVLLARALCAAEKILLLDEPTAALDPMATAEFYELLKRLNGERGITVLMISHDFASAKKYASHILLLGHDENFFGTTEEFLASDIAKTYGGDHSDVHHT